MQLHCVKPWWFRRKIKDIYLLMNFHFPVSIFITDYCVSCAMNIPLWASFLRQSIYWSEGKSGWQKWYFHHPHYSSFQKIHLHQWTTCCQIYNNDSPNDEEPKNAKRLCTRINNNDRNFSNVFRSFFGDLYVTYHPLANCKSSNNIAHKMISR